MNHVGPDAGAKHHIVRVGHGHRWQVQRRLQELAIPAWCPQEGGVRATLRTCTDLLQVNSVVRQFNAPRRELLDWLERCWQA